MSAKEGYQKFKQERLPNLKERLAALKEGQSPKTFFITCSDSRICPNEMTETSYGELFVVRNAGNTVPDPKSAKGNADKATLEYAVLALGVEEIVVCGHSHCGAVGALMSGVDASRLPYIKEYLDELAPLKEKAEREGMEGEAVIKENVRMQLKNIFAYDFVQEKVKSGELRLEGWLYHIESGDMEVVASHEDLL